MKNKGLRFEFGGWKKWQKDVREERERGEEGREGARKKRYARSMFALNFFSALKKRKLKIKNKK